MNRYLMLIALFWSCSFIYAQHSHNSDTDSESKIIKHPPHGGVVQKDKNVYVEIVTDWFKVKNNSKIYFYNSSGKNISEKVVFQHLKIEGETLNKTVHVQKLNEGFIASLPSGKYYEVILHATYKNKEIHVHFTSSGGLNN